MSAFALVLLIAGASTSSDPVVARAGKEEITSSQVIQRMTARKATGAHLTPKEAVEELLDEAVLALEAEKQGLGADKELLQALEPLRRRLAAEALVELELYGSVKVDEEQVKKLFHARADTVRAAHIVLATEAEAQALLGRLEKGATFAEEAKRSLDVRTANSGGSLGLVSRGDLNPAEAEEAFAAPLGKTVGPVKLPLGFGVLKVTERNVGTDADYAARAPALREFAEKQLREQVRGHYLAQLRAKAKVKVDDAVVRGTGNRLEASAEDAKKVVASGGGEQVLLEELLSVMRETFKGQPMGHMGGSTVKSQFASQLLDRKLLESAAMERGFGKSERVKALLRPAEREVLAQLLGRRLAAAEAAPTAADVRAFFEQNRASFRQPGRRSCAFIQVVTEKQAQNLRQQLQAGTSFAQLAKENSLDEASAARGGELGELTDDAITELEDVGKERALAEAFRDTKPDVVSQPIRGQQAYFLVKCRARVPERQLELAEVEAGIRRQLTAEREAAAVRRQAAALRKVSRTTVDAAALTRVLGGAHGG